MNNVLFAVIAIVYLLFVSFYIAKKNQLLPWSFGLFFASIILPSVFPYDQLMIVAGFAIVVTAALIENKLVRQPAQAALAAQQAEESEDKTEDAEEEQKVSNGKTSEE